MMILTFLLLKGLRFPTVYKGWAEIDSSIDPTREKSEFQIHVPFLATSETLDYPIVGYNVIQEIIDRDSEESSVSSSNIVDCLKASFVSEEKQIKLTHWLTSSSAQSLLSFVRLKLLRKM